MLANCSQQAVEVLLPPLAEGYWSPWKISSIRMGCTAERCAAGTLRVWLPLVQPQPELAPERRNNARSAIVATATPTPAATLPGRSALMVTALRRAPSLKAVARMIAAHRREQVVLLV